MQTERRAWLIVGMLFLFMLINFADKAVIGLSAVPIMQDLHLTHAQFGAVGSSFFLFFSIGAVLVGFLVNRVATRWVLAVMSAIWAIAQLPMLGAASLPLLYGNRILLGAGEGPAYPVALHAVYKWFPNDRRPFPTSFVSFGGAVGTGLLAPLITWVILTYSWHEAFFVLGVAGAIWTVAWLVVGREGPLDAAHETAAIARGPTYIPYGRLLTCRSILGGFVLGFAAYWMLTIAVIWLPSYLTRGVGFTPRQTGWIVTLPSLVQIIIQPGIASISQRLKARGVSSRMSRGVLTSLCVLLSGLLTLALPHTDGGLVTIVCVAVAFSAATIIFIMGHVIAAEITPVAQRGAVLGINNAIATTAGLAAPFVMGLLIDEGGNVAAGFQTAFTIAGALVTVAAILGLILINPEADLARFGRRLITEPSLAPVPVVDV